MEHVDIICFDCNCNIGFEMALTIGHLLGKNGVKSTKSRLRLKLKRYKIIKWFIEFSDLDLPIEEWLNNFFTVTVSQETAKTKFYRAFGAPKTTLFLIPFKKYVPHREVRGIIRCSSTSSIH